MDLFDYMREQNMQNESPLANRMRPKTLEEVVGQQHIIGKDKLLYRAIRADKLSSVIFYGPPGTGKTTLAKVIAGVTKAEFVSINATAAGKKDMEAVVEQAKNSLGMYGRRTILFIDEIHRLSRQVEEVLYPALEDYALDIIMGKGPAARSIRIELNKFTLIGATTRAGSLSAPLRDRFGVIQRLGLYNTEQLSDIVKRSAVLLGVACDDDGAEEIAKRSRGTPRIANRFLRRVRDFAEVMGNGRITADIAKIALNRMDVDKLGLDSLDKRLLTMIIKGYDGGPVGLETLAAAIGEESVTIEDVCEPYLMQLGFLSKTPRGRVATQLAYDHLGFLKDGQTHL